ncbi:MAG: RNA methyltransferase [Treponema sp.]|jgi:TrmH family RNA methyltransferase|nr:RNA methyltransferase [Treponema sp.]
MMKKILINSENAEYQIIESLKLNRAKRTKAHEVFIEGIEPIKQALKAGVEITRIITAKSAALSGWAKNVILSQGKGAVQGAAIIEMAPWLYNKLCDRQEPSEMLVTVRISMLKLNDLQLPEEPFLLLLDRPADTGNLGSILRSANCFGVDAALILGHSADVYDPKTIRASLGSVFHTPVAQIESMKELEEFIRTEKKRNALRVLGTDSSGELSLRNERLRRPIMIVIGNEAKGMSVALKGLCDGIAAIPLTGAVNSLNVASAASIFMWEAARIEIPSLG